MFLQNQNKLTKQLYYIPCLYVTVFLIPQEGLETFSSHHLGGLIGLPYLQSHLYYILLQNKVAKYLV
jgi:hypothetical protein